MSHESAFRCRFTTQRCFLFLLLRFLGRFHSSKHAGNVGRQFLSRRLLRADLFYFILHLWVCICLRELLCRCCVFRSARYLDGNGGDLLLRATRLFVPRVEPWLRLLYCVRKLRVELLYRCCRQLFMQLIPVESLTLGGHERRLRRWPEARRAVFLCRSLVIQRRVVQKHLLRAGGWEEECAREDKHEHDEQVDDQQQPVTVALPRDKALLDPELHRTESE